MRRYIILFLILNVFSQKGRCDLIVHEYLYGQKVTLDTNTGYYWYWNLKDFINMTYAEQIKSISELGTYGNINGGWHMATAADMSSLWSYPELNLCLAFSWSYNDPYSTSRIGRYDDSPDSGYHYQVGVSSSMDPPVKDLLGVSPILDESSTMPGLSAWVTTDAPVVPVPSALILGSLGLTFSGWLLKRKRMI